MQMTTTFDEARCGREVKARLHDMAVMGDPFSGPAYGQFEKSKGLGMIIGVVASVVTMGAALPMMMGTLAMQIAGGVMFAGGALTGIGAVTGNKKLQKIGGIMSLAGGIGALGAGALGAAGGAGNASLAEFGKAASASFDSATGGVLGLADRGAAYAATSAEAAGAGAGTSSAAASAPPIDQANISNLPPADAAATPAAQTTLTGGDGNGLINKTIAADNPNVLKLDGSSDMMKSAAAVPGGDAPITVQPGSDSVTSQVAANGWKPTGLMNKSLSTEGLGAWAKENSELLKLSMSAVEKGATAMMTPDQQAVADALAAKYGAEASTLKTQQEILAYQQNNMTKQVAMISADDPDMENKVKNAAANKTPVVFIPSIGAGGIKQTGGAWNAGTANVAQQPARQPTFGQQPAAA